MERKKSEEEDEISKQRGKAGASAPSPRKRTRSDADTDGASGAGGGGAMCDDVVGNILARLPARDAVACMALSKHHRRLIRSPEFRSLHRRLAPPLPRPHVAYVVTTPIKRGPGTGTVSRFHGFHVAGGGLTSGTTTNAPIRALAGGRYLDMAYVNTCNGVVLLAKKEFSSSSSSSCRCALWNPAVADGVKEVSVPASPERHCLVLGLGYAGRSETYKMLLCHKDMSRSHSLLGGVKKCFNHHKCRVDYSLVIHELGNTDKEVRLQTIISAQPFLEFSPKSLYIDGTIYLLHFVDNSVMLAFDMDDETVSTIKFPPGDPGQANYWFTRPVLSMEVSGHLCVVTNEARHQKALWFLTVDHKWEQRYLIGTARDIGYTLSDFYNWLVLGVWDCQGVLVLYLHGSGQSHLCLYHVETKKMFKAKIPCDLKPNQSGYEWSWGYRPTLVSPGSIVGKLNEDWEQRRDRSADMMLALKPINEQDRKKGCKMTLGTVCLMDFLVRIMRKLPNDMQDVVGMSSMDSEDPIFFSEDALYSDSD